MQNDSRTEGTGTPAAPTGITCTSLTGTLIGGGDENLSTFSFAGGTSRNSTYTLSLAAITSETLPAAGRSS